MLCRRCTSLSDEGRLSRATKPRIPLRLHGGGQASPASRDGLCSSCGGLLGTDETTERVEQKQSQLERFGLSGGVPRLLKSPDPEDA